MENNILSINDNKITIKTIDLVDIINQFREIENNITLKNSKHTKPITHDNLMKKIKKEIKVMKENGINSLVMFNESTYINSRGKTYLCYELNRDGMLQILNSESTLVRYKTIEYINKLEEDKKQLLEDNNGLYEIATNDKDVAERKYNADKIRFGWKSIRTLLEQCTYKDIEDTVSEIIDFHTNILKKKDRVYNYSSLDKTAYKQAIRTRCDDILSNIYNSCNDGTLRTVVKEIQENTLRSKLQTVNRKNAQIIGNLKEKIDNIYPRQSEFIVVNTHGFSNNYMYEYKNGRTVKTTAYCSWINNFPYDDIPDITYWDDVDFYKPIEMFINYTAKESYDIRNFDKSFIDMIFNNIYGVDDNIVQCVHSQRVGTVTNYTDGKVGFFIRNIKE